MYRNVQIRSQSRTLKTEELSRVCIITQDMQSRLILLILTGFIILLLCTLSVGAEETGSISITSDPNEAEVYITNQFRGYTPLTLDEIRSGMTRITLKKPNFQNWDGVIYVIPHSTTQITPVMAKTGTQFRNYGSVVVTSSPGATVLRNDNFVGTTDGGGTLTIAQTDLGIHLITIEKEGYNPYSDLIEVTSGKTTGVTAELTVVGSTPIVPPLPATIRQGSPLPTPPEKSPGSSAVLFCSLLFVTVHAVFRRRI